LINHTKGSLFRFFNIFASKQNEAKRILFRFIFACFCEAKKHFVRFISLRFFSLFCFNLFASKQKPFFFVILLQPFRLKHVFCNFASTFLLQSTFFCYFASTFSLQNTFFTIMLRLFRFKQCCRSGSSGIRTFLVRSGFWPSVLWIQIRKDPKLFAGSGSGIWNWR
jgi:hypothetical protein